MSGEPVVDRLRHPAFEPGGDRTLFEAPLSDRRRVAVVLQAAALLAHLEAARWRLVSRWQDLTVDERGVLRGARAAPGAGVVEKSDPHELLLRVFRSEDTISGPGIARRLASGLAEPWRRFLWRRSHHRLICEILDRAPFIWDAHFAACRTALAAEQVRGEASRLTVAGRGSFELRVLAAAASLREAADLLASPRALQLWCGPGRADGSATSSGRSDRRAAATRWRVKPPRTPGERLSASRDFRALGEFDRAEHLLRRATSSKARLLRADCCLEGGRPAAARRLVERLWSRRLSPTQRLDAAEIGTVAEVRASGSAAQSVWRERLLHAEPKVGRTRVELLAAELAWERREQAAARRHLRAAAPCRDRPTLAWRWHRLRAMAASHAGRLAAAEQELKAALGGSRRSLRPYEAAELWGRLADLRRRQDRLAHAERAARQAVRLVDGCSDKRRTAAALRRLLELRLRQGLVSGAVELLGDAAIAGRGGEAVAAPETVALAARFELIRGRPEAALAVVDRGLARSSMAEENARHRGELELLAARALGWLGRAAEARERLEELPTTAWTCVEAEERPAVWALAGDWQRARQSAARDEVGELWRKALAGEELDRQDWASLEALEPYRAARSTLDLHLLSAPGLPPSRQRQAACELRRVGAHAFADRLDGRREGAWRALETYLSPDLRAQRELATLFTGAGYFDTRLRWRDGANEQLLVAGPGGECELSAPASGGDLLLQAPALDSPLRALFALAARDFRPRPEPRRPPRRATGLIGESDKLRHALDRLERLATSEVSVLIHGETGTGKELAARQVHALSRRAARPFVAVNCAALSEALILSDLFGHVRGAFTGAHRDHAGVFETARGGTVFLDEVGDLPPSAQAKLLRVLQEGEVRRVGESLPRKVDLRVVAATHRDLREMVAEGEFREDLLYRLKVGSVTLPPLRHRGRDVLVLAEHFLDGSGRTLTPRAVQRLVQHAWPGNVRELRNVLQVAAALVEGTVIDAEHLELPRRGSAARSGYHQQVEDFRRGLVREALVASDGNRAAAARRLDLSRQALAYLVRRLGVG